MRTLFITFEEVSAYFISQIQSQFTTDYNLGMLALISFVAAIAIVWAVLKCQEIDWSEHPLLRRIKK